MKRKRGKAKQRILPQLSFRDVTSSEKLVIPADSTDVLAIYCPDTVAVATWNRYIGKVIVLANSAHRAVVPMKYDGNGVFAVRPNVKSIVGYKWKVDTSFQPGRYLVVI